MNQSKNVLFILNTKLPEDLFVENFEEHVRETEARKQQALEMKAKAEHTVKKFFKEKQEKELLTKLKEKYEV